MSGNVVHFVPPSAHRIADNREAFIRFCRDELTVFGRDLDWSSWNWPGTLFIKMGVSPRRVSPGDLIDEGIIDFAKAYFRYQQGMKPTEARSELMAIRVIEAALLLCRDRVDIDLVDIDVLDRAEQLAKEHYSESAAYNAARQLERLAVFLDKNRLVRVAIGQWKRSTRKPRNIAIQTGPEARARHAAKLPSEDALNAMAEMFANNPNDPRDIFTTSTFAMTLCAPVRITEVLELPVDCEVEEKDSNGVNRYGWRFYSSKGYEGDIRWIPSVMVPIAKEAIARIRALTESARRLAHWMESHEDEFYLHPDCPQVAQDIPLSCEQVCAALGIKSLSHTGLSVQPSTYTLRDLARWTKERQPKDFPWLSQQPRTKLSNALFCMTRNQLHARRGTSPVILWTPNVNVFNKDLGAARDVQINCQSIFDRHGYRDPMPSSLAIAARRLARQKSELDELKAFNEALLARFVRWEYNAYKHGLSEAHLDADLPRINRGRSVK